MMMGMHSGTIIAGLGLVIGLHVACETLPSRDRQKETPAEQSGVGPPAQVLADVDGHPVRLEEVTSLMEATDAGLAPDEALEALIVQKLLVNEAVRRGFGAHREVAFTRKSELTTQLLKRTAESITPETIGVDVLTDYYRANKHRFVHGEERIVTHFVALTGQGKWSDDKAREAAETVRAAVEGASSSAEFEARVESALSSEQKKWKVESLPAFERTGSNFETAFADGAFAIRRGERISEPLKTSFGWHVIWLSNIVPPRNESFDDAREEIAALLLPRIQQESVAALVSRLLKEGDPFVYEDALAVGEVAP